MARYIDADALVRAISLYANRTSLGQICPPDLSYSEMLDIIADAPTADVAPRAEVAREIFAEIEREFSGAYWYKGYTIERYIAELKKKYLEEKK